MRRGSEGKDDKVNEVKIERNGIPKKGRKDEKR